MTSSSLNSAAERFRVFRRSTNTNSFGLYGLWLINSKGQVWEVAANTLNAKAVGEFYDIPLCQDPEGPMAPVFARAGFELANQRPSAPPTVAKKLFEDDPKTW